MSGVNWSLANQGGGFDYLQSLMQLGQVRSASLANQTREHALIRAQRQDAARPMIQQRVEANDYGGAQAAAIGVGDYDMARTLGGLAEDQRKRLGAENELVGRAANALRRLPVDQRGAVFHGMKPHFLRQGFSPDELDDITDLSDVNLDQLMVRSQSIEDYLSSQLTQGRIDDIGTDNERADMLAGNTVRNTDDVIADRAARRGLTARGQDMAEARGRYGIGVASSDRRRGQDISSATQRRGQDLANDRARNPKAQTRGGRGSFQRIAEDANGNRVGWNGKSWVPIK